MGKRLFLGIADNNRCASVVVGDSRGRILTTGVGGSVNHRLWGMHQAKTNFRRIMQAVGPELWSRLEGVCFTYKSDCVHNHGEVLPIVEDLLNRVHVQVEKFPISCTLGIHGPKDRLVLIGGQRALGVFRPEGGEAHKTKGEVPDWNLSQRLHAQLDKVVRQGTVQELEALRMLQQLERKGECLYVQALALDQLIEEGNPWALEVAHDLACDLVRLIRKLAPKLNCPDLVIGLYGALLLGCGTIREKVHYLLKLLFPQAEVINAPLAPAKGAYLSSLLTRKARQEEEVFTNFYHSAQKWLRKGRLDFVTPSTGIYRNNY